MTLYIIQYSRARTRKKKFYFIHNTENTKISKKHALQKQMLINKTKKYGM